MPRLSAILVVVVAMAGCPESDAPVDSGRAEGLAFSDLGPDQSRSDLSLDAGQRDGVVAPDGGSDGLPACSTFAQFTCTELDSSRCSATCTAGATTLAVVCGPHDMCVCRTNELVLEACTPAGTGCARCESVFGCCAPWFNGN